MAPTARARRLACPARRRGSRCSASPSEFKRRAASDPRVPDAAELAERFASDFSAGLDLVLAGDHASLFEGDPTS